jgi:transposase-like protein
MNPEFTNEEKIEILDDCVMLGSVTQAADKWGVARQTIYKWKRKRKEIEKEVKESDMIVKGRTGLIDDEEILEGISTYKQLMSRVGSLEERKEKLSAKVEYILVKVVNILETHPNLVDIHPKDLSKIMKDLHDVRKELSNEPTIIIEYKNKMREQTLQVLQDFLNMDQLREFAKRMEAIEVDYELI